MPKRTAQQPACEQHLDDDPAASLADINDNYLADETAVVKALLASIQRSAERDARVQQTATRLITAARKQRRTAGGLAAFTDHYDLSSHEGVALMCLAEALLRIPDGETVDQLIADKLTAANWERHLGAGDSWFTNASTWALMLSGKLLEPPRLEHGREQLSQYLMGQLKNLFARLEEPLLRAAMKGAMRIMARDFVMGRTMAEALRRAEGDQGYRYSFDMLGEAALTSRDAQRYQAAYADAISTLGKHARPGMRYSISIKLSALCPRYEYTQAGRAVRQLSAAVGTLARQASQAGVALTVDAEESDRLLLSLQVFVAVYQELDGELDGKFDEQDDRQRGEGYSLGLAVQAYQKRALPVLRWLNALSTRAGRMIPVRLVKGAYWDTEIKRAQQAGLRAYPVFTRKGNTDVSYLACAHYLLRQCRYLYPQFATHNAHTLAHIYEYAGSTPYECQRLHGMGEELYAAFSAIHQANIPCRVYAPIGAHEDLLPYLVRRLLENGANTSFVNQLKKQDADAAALIADPIAKTEALASIPHPQIPLPAALFGTERRNSAGLNLADENEARPLLRYLAAAKNTQWMAAPLVGGRIIHGIKQTVADPGSGRSIGHVEFVRPAEMGALINKAIDTAWQAWPGWNATPAAARAALLEKAAVLYQQNQYQLISLCVYEAGKTIPEAHAELREAIDFLRYYAQECRRLFGDALRLPGPTGEHNELQLQGRGVFMCISPWNFPAAIFTGQVAAALAAGNTVLAKPAEQTSLTAYYCTQLLHQAGVPAAALALVPGEGKAVGTAALADARLAGVAFTGSTETAQRINLALARRPGPIAALIAETGGQNAMLVDSSALAEQAVPDIIHSGFYSAGQRCSALRVLYLQADIAERILALLTGCMDELVIGAAAHLDTDIGPVISRIAKRNLQAHIDNYRRQGKLLYQCRLPADCAHGHFIAPAVIEIDSIGELTQEHFGPIIHVVRFNEGQLDKVIDDINRCGYGLTLGIHSRIVRRCEQLRQQAQVGNVYVNRNMVGAVVGVQPFGGCKLSGTGPKAGGPNYLLRFATEKTCSINTAAAGGDAGLLNLS